MSFKFIYIGLSFYKQLTTLITIVYFMSQSNNPQVLRETNFLNFQGLPGVGGLFHISEYYGLGKIVV